MLKEANPALSCLQQRKYLNVFTAEHNLIVDLVENSEISLCRRVRGILSVHGSEASIN